MVRESKIRELLNDKVISRFDEVLSKFGFKYQKTKKVFIRQVNELNQIVYLYSSSSALSYDEKNENLLLSLNISSRLEIPAYENWHLEKLGDKPNFSLILDNLTSQIELNFNDFDSESFYEPTKSQQFKHYVTHSLITGNTNNELVLIDEFLEIDVPNILFKFKENSTILQIHKNRKYPFQYIYLLVYGGFMENAKEEFQKYYKHLINEIENQIKISETGASDSIETLNILIKNSQKITDLTFTNPYKRNIKISELKNDYFEFSNETKFNEILRLDTSQYEIRSINMNSIGEILIFADNHKIIKLNPKGELILEKEIETKKGFEKIFWEVPSGVIKNTNNFYVNNYIIKSDNTILELLLPIQKLKKDKLQNPHISDFAFNEISNKYLVIYEDNFITYCQVSQRCC